MIPIFHSTLHGPIVDGFFSKYFITGTSNFCIKHWNEATHSAKHFINFSALIIEACETLQTDWKDLHVNFKQLFVRSFLTCRDTSPFFERKASVPSEGKIVKPSVFWGKFHHSEEMLPRKTAIYFLLGFIRQRHIHSLLTMLEAPRPK